MSLLLDGVSFRYRPDAPEVLRDLTLAVPSGTFRGLTAPSGTGKSTLLRIAGLLLRPGSGRVVVDGTPVTTTGYGVPPPLRRRVGLVFQSPRAATNPRLTLREIVAEPLSTAAGSRRPRPARHTERLAELVDLVQLTDDLLDRLPHQVSDGQLQRACLARALALDPVLLLCDEPTAMLDAPTTAVIMAVLRSRSEAGAAVLVASHDGALLAAVADEVAELPRPVVASARARAPELLR